MLIVDDEKEIRDLLKEKLEQEHFLVITASGAEEAIILANKEKPDLILMDIAMQGIDGYAACQKLKDDPNTEKIPVLFLTGKDLDPKSIIERCQSLSAAGYISK